MRQPPIPIPVPDADTFADAGRTADAYPDSWAATYAIAERYASDAYAAGFTDAWIYTHTHTDLLPATDHDRNPDPAAVADAVARAVINAPANTYATNAELAGIYANAWRSAWIAADRSGTPADDAGSSAGADPGRPQTDPHR